MTALAVLGAALLGAICVAAAELRRRQMHLWLPGYCLRRLRTPASRPAAGTRHLLFCFVDHFEPGWNRADLARERSRVDAWFRGYPAMSRQFTDADGRHPRHTWFYPPHYYREEHVAKLVELCLRGLGEIEMHLHHNRMTPFPDTSGSLRRKILECIATYGRHGIFRTRIAGRDVVRYAFVHGDWALDNGRRGCCGVNDELSILRETGCYADFTFPAYLMESQPRTVNAIYYVKDDPRRPKSYDRGREVAVGAGASEDLVMVQGPIGLRWRRARRRPAVDYGEVSSHNPPTPRRVDFWVRTGVHVVGREDWVVVKVFTHGAPEGEHAVLLGPQIEAMHAYLGERYNDGRAWALHYVTARELFNIIKAAEAGENGSPGQFRDYLLSPYAYAAPAHGAP